MSVLDEFLQMSGQANIGDAFIAYDGEVEEEVLRAADSVWEKMEGKDVEERNLGGLWGQLEGTRVGVVRGDVRQLRVDGLMNPANSAGLGCFQPSHKCLDNLIHRAAGPRLRQQCRQRIAQRGMALPCGSPPLLTDAFFLPCKYVIHVTGPQISSLPITAQDRNDLYQSYIRFYHVAAQAKMESVAVCCLSTGIFGFPQKEAARIACQATKDFIQSNPGALKMIIFDVFLASDADLYRQRIPSVFLMDQNVKAARQALTKASRIFIVAGAGMSAYPPGGPNVYVDADAFAVVYPDMPARGYRTAYETMGLFRSPLPESVKWGFLARHMHNMSNAFPPCNGYQYLLNLVRGKNIFVLTSNVDRCFARANFPLDRIYTPQGEWSWYQCAIPCSQDSVWPSAPLLDKILPHVGVDGELPPHLVPKCPNCGGPVMGNVRGSSRFIHAPYLKQQERLIAWLEESLRAGTVPGDFVVMEIGSGFNTPIICRAPAESISREFGCPLIRINPDHSECDIHGAISLPNGWAILETLLTDQNNCLDGDVQILPAQSERPAPVFPEWREIFASLR